MSKNLFVLFLIVVLSIVSFVPQAPATAAPLMQEETTPEIIMIPEQLDGYSKEAVIINGHIDSNGAITVTLELSGFAWWMTYATADPQIWGYNCEQLQSDDETDPWIGTWVCTQSVPSFKNIEVTHSAIAIQCDPEKNGYIRWTVRTNAGVVAAVERQCPRVQEASGHISVEFSGNPQMERLVVMNSGPIKLTLDAPDEIASPVVFAKNDRNQVTTVDNWEVNAAGQRTLVQSLPESIQEIWVENPVISWEGAGPWVVNESGNGIYKSEDETAIAFSLTRSRPVVIEDTTKWVWNFTASPAWAVSQYLPVKLSLVTKCKGLNNSGSFTWNVKLSENLVIRNSVRTSSATTGKVFWQLRSLNGILLASGSTRGPVCK